MSLFIKLFNTTTEYNVYTADTANFILPNVSCAMDDLTTVHYNPSSHAPTETRLVAKYNVTDTSSPTKLFYADSGSGSGSGGEPPFSAMEIDGVEQSEVVTAYTFDTTGEHTVKYTLTDPTSIGDNAFYQCYGLTSIDIPNSVTSISDTAFAGCTSLTSIAIPNSVTSIGQSAFYNCYSLTSCTIGSGVTSIGGSAFIGCGFLTSITVEATTPPTLGTSAFASTNNCPIYVPSDSVTAYKTNWSAYSSRIQAIP